MITVSETYDTAGQYQLEIHPAAQNIWVELSGGGGAAAETEEESTGGDGGYVEGYLPQAAGETLEIFVGGGGTIGDSSGGFNGGGSGQSVAFASSGGGGGASDIRIGGTTLADRAAVAAGGGGACRRDDQNVFAGDGGGLVGGSPDDGRSSPAEGGTQDSGGVGEGDDGQLGVGGDGQSDDWSGGGGGAGYYGGGGGNGSPIDEPGAGAGGSSYTDELNNSDTVAGDGASGGFSASTSPSDPSGDDGSVTVTYEIEAEAASDLQVTGEDDTELTLSWDPSDELAEDDSQHVYRDTEPGVDPETATELAGLGATEDSYTDTDLPNGTTHYYVVETVINKDGETSTAVSNEADGQTTIPQVDGFSLDASVQDELVVELPQALNAGNYRIRWKRSSEADYDPGDEVTLAYDALPLEYAITPVLDGEMYDIGVRSETEEVTSAWHTAEEITKLVPVSGLSATPADESVPNYQSDLSLTWSVKSDYEGSQQVYVYETVENDEGLGDLIATIDAEAGSYTLDSSELQVGRDYLITVRTRTQYVHADTEQSFEASRAGLQAAFYAEIDDPRQDGTITIDPPKSVSNAQIRHSATSNVDIATPDLGPELRTLARSNPDVDLRTRLLDSEGNEVRDDRVFMGVLGEVETQGQSDEATLKTKGRAWYLETDSPEWPVQFSNIRVWEALRQYGNEQLDDWDVTVQPDPGATIEEGTVAQDPDTEAEWLDLLENHLADTDPFYIDDTGHFNQARTSFTFDPPGPFEGGSADIAFDDDYSDGRGVEFSSSGDDMPYPEFEVHHTIEADNVGVAARFDVSSVDSEENNATVELELVDADTDEVVDSITIYEGSTGANVIWQGFGSDNFPIGLPSGVDSWPSDIEPGTYYFRLECTESPSAAGEATILDIFSVFDSRFSYTWDETVHEVDGYLDGPEMYPVVDFEGPVEERETNIDAAYLSSVWPNTTEEQAIALSNDGGDNWIEAENTETLTANFTDSELYGSQLRVRFTFSRCDDGAQDQTPRYGYEGQSVDSYELSFDQSSVAVINDAVYSADHKTNITDLCDRGRMNWVEDHTADGKVLEIFPIGTEADDDVSWSTLDWSRTDGSHDYANRVVARGATKPEDERENGDDVRYEATVQDDEEIQQRLDDGLPEEKAIVTRTVLDPELSSQEEVNAEAFSTLEDLVTADDASGSVDVVPTFVKPGYAYPVPEFEDGDGNVPVKVLEQVNLSQGYADASGDLQFEQPHNWVRAVDPIERDVGGLKRLF